MKMNLRPLLLLGIVMASAHAFAAPVPRIMQVFIGGHSGPSYEIVYDGRDLKYYKAGDMHALTEIKPEVVSISEEKWGAFLRSLDDIQIWRWKRRYVDPSVADGTTWSCVIVYDTQKDRTLVSYGSNGRPAKFDEFLKAVATLVDGREFK
jgi:hypothetical protein